MIKFETIGMLDRVVVNPVLTSATDVENFDFITVDGDLYIVMNENHDSTEYTIPAGEFLNGHLVKSLEGQKFVIEGKHVTGGTEELTVGSVLVVGDDGKLETGDAAGVHFVVTDLGDPIKAKVVVAAEATEADDGNG